MYIKTQFNRNKRFLLSFFIIIGLLIVVPVFIKRPFVMNVLILCTIWSIMGLGWNIIGGYAGQISNGHALFYAIGAYVGAMTMKWFQLSPWISMWLGILLSVGIAFVIGTPLLRLRDHYFAISTMALVECTRIIFLNWQFIGGATGISFFFKRLSEWYSWQFTTKHPFYYISLGFMALCVILSKIIEISKFGYYCRAIKANQESAESSGIDAAKYKRYAYMISAGMVSIGGALYAQYLQYIDPAMLLPLSNSMLIVLVCVMGGVGTVWGPVLGGFLLMTISEYSRSFFVQYSGLNLVIYGILVVVIVLFLPKGLISLINIRKHSKFSRVKTKLFTKI